MEPCLALQRDGGPRHLQAMQAMTASARVQARVEWRGNSGAVLSHAPHPIPTALVGQHVEGFEMTDRVGFTPSDINQNLNNVIGARRCM
jgi:hypothetical protein